MTRRDIGGWLLMLPSLALFIFFAWVPLVQGVIMSLFKTKGFTIKEFNDFGNFAAMFKDPLFWVALGNTVKYTFWWLLLGFTTSLVVSLALNEAAHASHLFRSVVYLPVMIPTIAAAQIFRYMYQVSEGGLVNTLLGALGFAPSQLLQDATLVIPLIVVMIVWKNFGSSCLIYLAALQNVSQDLYEAALMDGAGIWKRTWHITLPSIKNIMRMQLLMALVAGFGFMIEPEIMTGGGPNNASLTIMELVFRQAFMYIKTGNAMAMSVVIMALQMLMMTIRNFLEHRLVHENLDWQ